jgi:DNA-binding response OmpR family regulator
MSFIFYRDVFGGWRWEFRNSSGNVRDSQQSYVTREECVSAADAAALQIGCAPANSLQKRSILCVQPDKDLGRSLNQALAAYRTVIAPTSLEAVRHLHSGVFDAYVLDYRLPQSSGIHLCRHIRRSDAHGPILFYTAAGSEDQRDRAFKAGASGYICASSGTDTLCDELRIQLETAELQSKRARADEEKAIHDELEARVAAALNRSSRGRQLAAGATARMARARAYEKFTESGGTPAYFERWWPDLFSSSAARYFGSRAEVPDAEKP